MKMPAPAAPHASRLSQEPAALDLMQLAGGSIARRLVPLLGLIVVAVISYLLVR